MQALAVPTSPTSADGAVLVRARKVSKHFGGLYAVDGMSIALRRGELLGLIGPNGAGKTTLFNLLAGSLKPDSGSILVAGEELSGSCLLYTSPSPRD